jgi:arylsulfatase A-like enzyme
MARRRRIAAGLGGGLLAVALLLVAAHCASLRSGRHPNVLWIVWDTVRADRLSLYGNRRVTTPFLDRWARDARVFDNVLSVASTTVPAHASMFTNRLALEHGADNTRCFLRSELETLPEIFQANGYRTFLYSENPFISQETGFGQGFDAVVHPWSQAHRARSASILENKIPPRIRSPKLAGKLRDPSIPHWALSACGILGQEVLLDWLGAGDQGRPYFAFLNYMEAHAPVITPIAYRQRMMTSEQVDRSYALNITPASIWQYTFGLRDYQPEDIEVIRGTYDASLAEMDALLQELLGRLKKTGDLRNTIVVVTSDHGEFLGEHHLLDHEYALYQEVLRVPLVLYYPPKVKRGREPRPVTNQDLYPTLLSLAGLAGPASPGPGPDGSLSISLLDPDPQRVRLAEFPTAPEPPFAEARRVKPDFDPTPYRRSLAAIVDGDRKLIRGTDGRDELYILTSDPGEEANLDSQQPDLATALANRLQQLLAKRTPPRREPPAASAVTEEQKAVLRSLGYIGTEGHEAGPTPPPAPDTTARHGAPSP